MWHSAPPVGHLSYVTILSASLLLSISLQNEETFFTPKDTNKHLLEPVAQLLVNFPALYGTVNFITVFTRTYPHLD